MKIARVAVALLLALAACGGSPSDDAGARGRYGDGISPPASPAEQRPSRRATSREATPDDGGAPSTAAGIPNGSSGRSAPYFDDAGVGAMARRYLQPSPATSLFVEMDHMQGRRPTAQAIDHVRAILARETGKRVTIDVDDELKDPQGTYSFEDIEELEDRHRDERSGGSRATMWVLYLDGKLERESGTVGVAVRASVAVVFYDNVRQAGGSVVTADDIERAVLTHEVGHLLALVNIGYTSRHDREDPESPGHSRSEGSVMYAQVENKGLVALITGGPADDFDQQDRDDLAMLREG